MEEFISIITPIVVAFIAGYLTGIYASIGKGDSGKGQVNNIDITFHLDETPSLEVHTIDQKGDLWDVDTTADEPIGYKQNKRK